MNRNSRLLITSLVLSTCGGTLPSCGDPRGGDSPNEPEPRHGASSFGYVIDNNVYACPDQTECWIQTAIRRTPNATVIRIAPTGNWFVSIPQEAWGRPATETSLIQIHSPDEHAVTTVGLRFIRYAGPGHVLSSDGSFELYIIDSNGKKAMARSNLVATSRSGRIADFNFENNAIETWESVGAYALLEPPTASVLALASTDSFRRNIVAIQWLGESTLAVELGQPLGLENETIVCDIAEDRIIRSFAGYRIAAPPSGELVALTNCSGGDALIAYMQNNNTNVYVEPIPLGEMEFVTDISPDAQYCLVAAHPAGPPGTLPQTSLRNVRRPRHSLLDINGVVHFRGWMNCNCEP